MFDLTNAPVDLHSRVHELPLEEKPWNIGLITGPSGAGKSTLAKVLWPNSVEPAKLWHPNASLLDAFPADMGIKEVVSILSSVGFSSPPAWLRAFSNLSTGQQFRATLALCIAQTRGVAGASPMVFDEFTSVVDRTVAKVGSAALAKMVRRSKMQFVAVTCHSDVMEWLQPDWVYQVDEGLFSWRGLRRKPEIQIKIVRVKTSAWALFAPHHYLTKSILSSAVCFLATWDNQPVAFSAWLPFLGRGPAARREHRTVCLPDFQGVGIGQVLSTTIASLFKGLKYRVLSTTTHPGLIGSRLRNKDWELMRIPSLLKTRKDKMIRSHAYTRLTAGFEYVGPAMEERQARELLQT